MSHDASHVPFFFFFSQSLFPLVELYWNKFYDCKVLVEALSYACWRFCMSAALVQLIFVCLLFPSRCCKSIFGFFFCCFHPDVASSNQVADCSIRYCIKFAIAFLSFFRLFHSVVIYIVCCSSVHIAGSKSYLFVKHCHNFLL